MRPMENNWRYFDDFFPDLHVCECLFFSSFCCLINMEWLFIAISKSLMSLEPGNFHFMKREQQWREASRHWFNLLKDHDLRPVLCAKDLGACVNLDALKLAIFYPRNHKIEVWLLAPAFYSPAAVKQPNNKRVELEGVKKMAWPSSTTPLT